MKYIAGKAPDWTTTDVYLDGKKLQYCFEADDSLGKAYVYLLDENGIVTDDYKVLYGNVEFKQVVETTEDKPLTLYAGELLGDAREFSYHTNKGSIEGNKFLNSDNVQLIIKFRGSDFKEAANAVMQRLRELGLIT